MSMKCANCGRIIVGSGFLGWSHYTNNPKCKSPSPRIDYAKAEHDLFGGAYK